MPVFDRPSHDALRAAAPHAPHSTCETLDTLEHACMTMLDVCFAAFVGDVAERLTCREADALAALYRSAGQRLRADMLLEAHLGSDDQAHPPGHTDTTTTPAS